MTSVGENLVFALSARPKKTQGRTQGSPLRPALTLASAGTALHELRLARHRDRRNGEFDPVVLGRGEVFLGGHELVPGDRLAGVGGEASHDGDEGALAHV